MPKQSPNPTDQPMDSGEESPGGGRFSALTKIKVLVLVIAVVVVECLVAYMYLPDAAQMEAVAASADQQQSQEILTDEENQNAEDLNAEKVEIDLGEFSVTAYQPVSSTTLRVNFHLYGVVKKEDEDEFLDLKEGNEHRFREQVNVIIRSADITDLTDPGLGLIKRQILEKTNRTVGKTLLRGVIFSDFAFIEQ